MTELPQKPSNGDTLSQEAADTLIRSLRQKQGNWVEWGLACQQLQKAGYDPQKIFEATGFEPIQQNQIIVGAQVYTSIEKAGGTEAVRSHFTNRGSDILYELRLLDHEGRATAAELILTHKLTADDARDVAKAVKEFSHLRTLPDGFSNHPGDAIAYQSWKLARQKSDLQERSRLIAKGLRFAHSDTARQQIEQLLVDFTVVPKRPAPIMPFYRLESEEELPRIVPVVGRLPLSSDAISAVPLIEETEPFRMVKFVGEQAWVPIPGWQVILSAEDPVVILCDSDRLPNQQNNKSEPVLVVVDRRTREWDVNSYFIVDQSGQVEIQWFETKPEQRLLGKVIVVLRPKRILDEELTKEPWLVDE